MPYNGYAELNSLPPEAFLKWEDFVTPLDSLPENADRIVQQYEKGREIGSRYRTVHIGAYGTWSASGGPEGRTLGSYEGIGFHSCTADLLRGFLESEAEILVHRKNLDAPVRIKEASPGHVPADALPPERDAFDREFRM